ncbi:MAG: response regulator [Lachnospiraceae bacterium]|nr:response regulator [Lachnospiraceae bacterium]
MSEKPTTNEMPEVEEAPVVERKKMVLIVSEAETFTVKGLETRLKEVGVESDFVITKIRNLEMRVDSADLFVLYMDQSIGSNADVLVFLNDACTEKEKEMILIGTRLEYEAVMNYIDKKNVLHWFERPLNMEKFLEQVESYVDAASAEARKKSILIVDDDVAYMQMIRKWLKDSYRVGMANSGAQAITWLAKNEADLILLDYEMPVTSGPKVLEMLRSEAETSTVPVMFLTGKGDRMSILRVLDLKPADYLLKNIDRKQLLEKVDGFFKEKAATRRQK